MKRILSMALVLIMALSLISAISVFAEGTEEGTLGTVVVFAKTFEDSNVSGSGFNSIETETNGNHYASFKNFNTTKIVKDGKKSATDTSNQRLGSEFYTFRFKFLNDTAIYKNNKNYHLTWDGFWSENGVRSKASKGSSGFDNVSGGKLATYNGTSTQATATGQWYGQHNTTPGKSTVVGVQNYNESTGWTELGFKNISYKLWDGTNQDTVGVSPAQVTIKGFFMQWGNTGDMIGKLLASQKAYQGFGFTNAASYKFTITADDIYGDEAMVDGSGNRYLAKTTEEIQALPDSERYYQVDGQNVEYKTVFKEYNLNMDCTHLASAKRTANFANAVNAMGVEIGLDNIYLKADAMFYNDTVTADEDLTVKAVTNTYTGESQTINGSGTIENVNDYYGTTYTVTGAADGIEATYNGEKLAVSASNGSFTITIAPEMVTKNGELVIKKLDRVVLFYSSVEEGDPNVRASNHGMFSFANDNGNSVAQLAGWDAAALINSYVAKGHTEDYYPRVEYKNGDVYLNKNVTYVVSYKHKYMDGNTVLTNVTFTQPFINHPAPAITKSLESWGHYNGGKQHGGGGVSGTVGENGWISVSKNFTPTVFEADATSAQFGNLQPEFKGFNLKNGIFDNAAKAAVEANTVDGVVDKDAAAADLAAELAKHDYKLYVDDFKLEAIVESVNVNVDAENADVEINGVDIENGESAKVGKGYKSTIKVSVKEGYELESVKINGVAQTIGEDGTVTVKNIFNADADLEVVAEAPYVAPSVNVSEYKTAKNYVYKVGDEDVTSPYTVIMYGKIAGTPESYGFALSNGEASVKLDAKSIGADGVFAIRVVGGAILPGSYTATPYWTADEETTGEAYTIEIAE